MADDLYFTRTTLLVPFNGANNSTVFTDYSFNPKTLTAVGNAKIVTAQSKFGGSSGYFDGGGDYLTTPLYMTNSTYWCIEAWVRLSSLGKVHTIFGYYPGSVNFRWYFAIGPDNKPGIWYAPSYYNSNTALLINTWYHVAFTSNGNIVKFYLNGVEDGSYNITLNSFLTSGTGRIGIYNTGSNTEAFFGYMQDLRMTFNWPPRYTENFTPPTESLPRTQDLTCSGFLCSPELKTCNPASISGTPQGFLCNPSLINYDSEDGGRYYIDGHIRIDSSPASRKVRLHCLNNSRLVKEVWSNPLTGYYKFDNLKNQSYYVWSEDYQRVFQPVSEIVKGLNSYG